MMLYDNPDYLWRETYFVLFDAADRPSLTTIEERIHEVDTRFEIRDPSATQNGLVESLIILAEADHAAIEVRYHEGDAVREETAGLLRQWEDAPRGFACRAVEGDLPSRLRRCGARFDVLHFEQVRAPVEGDEDDDEETVDPDALLLLLQVLTALTRGAAIDPQTGSLISAG